MWKSPPWLEFPAFLIIRKNVECCQLSTLFQPFFIRDQRAERREMRENEGFWKWGLARKRRKEGALGRKSTEKPTCPPCLKKRTNNPLLLHHGYRRCCVFRAPIHQTQERYLWEGLQMLSDSGGWWIQLLPKTACIIPHLLFRVWSTLLPF